MPIIWDSETSGLEEDYAAARTRPQPPEKTGLLKAAGMGAMRSSVALARGTALAASTLFPHESAPDDGTRIIPRKEDFFKFIDTKLNDAEKYWTPDPESVGWAGELIGNISGLPVQIGAGPGLMAVSAGLNTGSKLVEQGVDPTTAAVAGAGAGVANALMMKIPQAGGTLLKTAGASTLMPLIGAGQDYALKTGLESQGYTEQAATIDPLNPVSRLTDLTLGGVFGALGYHANRVTARANATALENVAARATEYHDLIQKAGGETALREQLPVETVDSLDTVRSYLKTLETNPFNKDALAGVDRHIEMLKGALGSVTEGKPVDVADHAGGMLKPAPKPLELQTLMDKWSAKYGMAPDEEAGVSALIQARAAKMKIPVDEFVGRYFADVTTEPPGEGSYYQGRTFDRFKPLDVPFDKMPVKEEYRLTSEQAQQLADTYGNGTIDRVTDRRFFETGQDRGNPEYGHRFKTTDNQPVRGATSFAVNGERDIIHTKLHEQPGNDAMIHYGVRPADIGGDFVAMRVGTARDGKPIFHLFSDSPVNTDAATVRSHGLALKAKSEEIAKSNEAKIHDISNDDGINEALAALGIRELFRPTERPSAVREGQPGGLGEGAGRSESQNNEVPGGPSGVTSDPTDPNVLYQSRPVVQPFYSKLLREVDALPQEKWNASDLLNKVRKTPGVKEEEIAWTGLDEFLKGKKSVTRAEVRAFLDENQVQVREVQLSGDAKYGSYVTPGGENYRELLLTLPTSETSKVSRRAELAALDRERPLNPAEQAEFDSLRGYAGGSGTYRSSHFNEPNILAHVRFNERPGPDGERILHLEEVQSDWAQAKRAGKRVPDAPLIDSTEKWAGMAIRRMLRYAAENDFDRMTWTTGEQQAERYDISKKMESVSYRKDGEQFIISGVDKNGQEHALGDFTEKQLPDAVGKELSQKITAGDGKPDGQWTKLAGLDLKVGGEGMKGFYDRILPQFLDKFGKKFGAKVEDINIKTGAYTLADLSGEANPLEAYAASLAKGETVHSIPITEAMRDSLLYEGQPLFQGEKGAVSFLRDGRAVIHALESPDFSTAVHELGHVFERTLDRSEKNEFTQWLFSEVPGSRWTREHSEKFAQAFEKYLSDGEAPTEGLKGAFEKFKSWLVDIYRNIKNSPLEMRLNSNVKGLFDAMLADSTVNRQARPEMAALHTLASAAHAENQNDLTALAGDPPAHLDLQPSPAPAAPAPAPPQFDASLYSESNMVKRFIAAPDRPTPGLSGLLRAEADLLEKADFGKVVIDGHAKEASWSTAQDWYKELNRFYRQGQGAIGKQSVVNALRKAAEGQFQTLTAGQQQMVEHALDSIARRAEPMLREIDAQELQVGDSFSDSTLDRRTVVAERDGKLILDNGKALGIDGTLRIAGEIDQSGRPPEKGYDALDYQVQSILQERGDILIVTGKDAAGNDITQPASEFIDTAKNDLAAAENRKHLYDRAAACMGLEF
ncbi:hypothetical protein [Oryzomonas japonica]|uniref:hypothetical protein n=1 Tax=Oryzomonas japonica TaxID=2603858 RepID=UPI00177BF097|nr:hypothetical protein [Oryzomonas japonica]